MAKLLAFLDWGDAGWGDPTLDFAAIPCDAIGRLWKGMKQRRRDRWANL